jgi:predicted outer membrane repeat protein
LAVAKRTVSTLLNNQSNTSGGTIQVGTISITDPSNFGVGWFRQVNDEMDNIYNNIGHGLKVHRITRVY